MPLSDEQAEELYRWVKEIHAAIVERGGPGAAGAAPQRRRHTWRDNPSSQLPLEQRDPVVKFLPRTWTGEDYRGMRFSECPPNFLGMLSHVLDAFAQKNDEQGRANYAATDRENAEAARMWRAKLEGKDGKPPPMTERELDETF